MKRHIAFRYKQDTVPLDMAGDVAYEELSSASHNNKKLTMQLGTKQTFKAERHKALPIVHQCGYPQPRPQAHCLPGLLHPVFTTAVRNTLTQIDVTAERRG